MKRLVVLLLTAISLLFALLLVASDGPQAKKPNQLPPASAPAQTPKSMENFPPECDALIRPGLEDHGMDDDFKVVDAWARAIELDDGPTFHKLLPDAAKRVFKSDDIMACANAAATRQSWEGQTLVSMALMYNARWFGALYSYQDKEQKRTVESFNRLAQEYTKLYNQLLLISTAPRPTYVPPTPITCSSTRFGDTVTTYCY